MKKTIAFIITAMLLVSFSVITFSASTNKTITYKGTPVIDGIEDEVWKTAESIDVKFFEVTSAPNNPNAATAVVKTLWDEKFFYIYATVTDPVIDISNAGNWYERDCIGIALDYNNVKGTPETLYDANDAAGLVDFGIDDTITPNKLYVDNITDVSRKVVPNDTGWVVEIAIPHLKAVTEGMNVGFEAQYNDARDGARQGITNWSEGGTDLWRYTDVLGTAVLTAAPVVEVIPEETTTETVNPETADNNNIIYIFAALSSAAVVILLKKRTIIS